MRETEHPLRRLARRPVTILIVLQLAALVVVGAGTVARFRVFSPVDEKPHFAYIQEVAEHGRLPYLGRDFVSRPVEAVDDGTYPGPPRYDPRTRGLSGESYEAFQPPLYYVLAAPAFLVTDNYRDKVTAVRAFDLLLLLFGVWILAVLARAVLRERWQIGYCLALSVLLWPGVVVRSVTISSAALEIPVVLLYLLALWNATERRSLRWLVAAGAFLGCCLLTKLTLVCLAPLLLVPFVALLRERRDGRAVAAVAVTVLLPALLLAPWVASNIDRYGSPTSNALAKRIQAPVVDTYHDLHGVRAITSRLWHFPRAVMPQEWWGEYGKPAFGVLLRALAAALLLAAVVAAVRRPRLLWSRAAALLGCPLPLGMATLVGIVLFADWPSFLPRYLYSLLAPFALFTTWLWLHDVPEDRERRYGNVLVGAAAVGTLIVFVTWAWMFGAYYFTDLGSSLGMHPAAHNVG